MNSIALKTRSVHSWAKANTAVLRYNSIFLSATATGRAGNIQVVLSSKVTVHGSMSGPFSSYTQSVHRSPVPHAPTLPAAALTRERLPPRRA